MNIALIAHDKKKKQLLNFVTAYEPIFKQHTLFATGTTGQQIIEEVSLEVNCLQSGPLGGDQQIGAKIATDDLDLIIFFRDPLTAQPHEPDITALLRLSDVYQIPVATNVATAEIIVRGLSNGWLDWRTIKDSVGEYHD